MATKKQKWIAAASAALIAEPALAVAHAGVPGVFVGLAVGAVAYHMMDDVPFVSAGEEKPSPIVAPTNMIANSKSLAYRLLNGKSTRPEVPTPPQAVPRAALAPSHFAQEDDIRMPVSMKSGDLFTFSQVLASGFVPSINKIFAGRTMDTGKDIFVTAEDLCHVALAGKTGGGKGSLMRLLMTQLCYIGASVLLLNPHYMRWVPAKDGASFDEDWTPFEGQHHSTNESYLKQPPIDCAKYPTIGTYLQWAVKTLLEGRIEKGRLGREKFKPFFVIIDEWPAIVNEVKDAPKYLSKLLREGRKYNIFVVVASQDFQVKTIGMEGGSVRECLLTVFYTGGDKVTARALLHENPIDIPENEIGKGIVMMRCTGTQNEPVLARVPFVDNAAVYRLLGPSTFKVKTVETEELDDLRIDMHSPVHHSPEAYSVSPRTSDAERETEAIAVTNVNSGMSVNEPVKPIHSAVNTDEYSLPPVNGSPDQGNNSPTYSHEEEVQILLAYAAILQSGKSITRTGIRDNLGWNNKQYERVIKPVCDKHHIG